MSRGFSIIESVYASFILLVAFLLTFQLFHAGLHYFRWTEEKTTALSLADKRMAQVRNWARSQNNWSGFPTGSDPAHPDFQITTTLSDYTLASPCKEIDSNYGQRRELTQTCKLVTVTTTWHRGKVDLFSLIADRGDRGWDGANPIQIGGAIPGVLTASASAHLTATANGPSGPLPDVTFNWFVEPVAPNPATATISPMRDGRSADLTNLTRFSSGGSGPSTGHCRVAVRAVYHGQERWGYTPTITLAP